jgi:PadR family transcriptional regulator, regulatory protein PadR
MTTQTLKILSAMLKDPEAELYGLELSKRSGLKPGTIYPILKRLLEAGWLERHWEDIDPVAEGRPKRRLYRLTRIGVPAARAALDKHLESLEQVQANEGVRPQPRLGIA